MSEQVREFSCREYILKAYPQIKTQNPPFFPKVIGMFTVRTMG